MLRSAEGASRSTHDRNAAFVLGLPGVRVGDASGRPPGRRAAIGRLRDYLAAVTMISTSKSGRARSALTQARAGGFSGSTQVFHTEFISANSAMSLIHKLAER